MLAFYTQVLKQYRANPSHLNHYLVVFLRRISGSDKKTGLGLMPMLWQLSMLRVFQAILSDVAIHKDRRFTDLLRFCQSVVRSMFDTLMAGSQPPATASGHAEDDTDLGTDAAYRRQLEERERAVAGTCAQLLLVELLFWKTPRGAEDIAEQYGYKEK